MMNHVIGDCHSLSFRLIPNCKIHHLPSVTMHRVGRDKLDAVDLQKFGVEKGDVCIFSFGEIDARIHFAKQRDEKHREIDEIIQTFVANYLTTINLNRSIYGNLCIVYTIVPASNYGIEINPESFAAAPLEERIFFTERLNAELRLQCAKREIEILDVFEDYADENGVLRREFSDSFHIDYRQYIPIQKKLEQILSKHRLI